MRSPRTLVSMSDDGTAELDAAMGLSPSDEDAVVDSAAFPVRRQSSRLGGRHVRTQF